MVVVDILANAIILAIVADIKQAIGGACARSS
jgi:hypothetical protein